MISLLASIPNLSTSGVSHSPSIQTAQVVGIISAYIMAGLIFLSFVLMVIGNIKWIRAKGDKDKSDSAKSLILIGIESIVITLVLFYASIFFIALFFPMTPQY